MNKIRLACRMVFSRAVYLANEAMEKSIELFLPNQLLPAPADGAHWVQLSPFGDFGNANGGKKVIQRFRKEDAESICNAFNGPLRKINQPLGMPFYEGHPDHPGFKGKPGHTNTQAQGRGKEMAVRHNATCAACATFANAAGDPEAAPCSEHGLFVRVDWNEDGKHLLANEAYHGHSVNWAAVPDGLEKGVQIFRPIRVKSAGFTNEPNIPVKPASLANAQEDDAPEVLPTVAAIPAKLKMLANFKEADEVTMEQVITGLETALANVIQVDAYEVLFDSLLLANAEKSPDAFKDFMADLHTRLGTDPKSGVAGLKAALEPKLTLADKADAVKKRREEANKAQAKHYEAQEDLQRSLANERKGRAADVVNLLVKLGKVGIKDAPAAVTQLANAGDKFEEIAGSLGNAGKVIHSLNLANAHAQVVHSEQNRQMKWQELMDKREKEFANETYEDRYRNVANSPEGTALFAQMKKNGAEE